MTPAMPRSGVITRLSRVATEDRMPANATRVLPAQRIALGTRVTSQSIRGCARRPAAAVRAAALLSAGPVRAAVARSPRAPVRRAEEAAGRTRAAPRLAPESLRASGLP